MSENKTDTRTEIIEAARHQFHIHGYEGTRLQKIADHIGVTKAMIHYYFNTKQELFERVYGQSVDQIFNNLSDVLDQDIPLFKKIEGLIDYCLKIAEERPRTLSFVVTESSRKSDWLKPIMEERIMLQLQSFDKELEQAASNYQIASVDAYTLLLHIFSLCFYPSISSTLNSALLKSSSQSSYKNKRKGIILDTILNWLTA